MAEAWSSRHGGAAVAILRIAITVVLSFAAGAWLTWGYVKGQGQTQAQTQTPVEKPSTSLAEAHKTPAAQSTPAHPAAPAPAVAPAPADPVPGDPGTQPGSITSQTPVVTVNGSVVTLRELEDTLLKKEGVEQVEQSVHHLLELTDWNKLKDNALIVATAMGPVRRCDVAVYLLRQKAGEVREELVNLALVNQALDAQGISIDQPAIDAELARMSKRLTETLEKHHQPITDLRSLIKQEKNVDLEDYVRQPGFKILTGMHILVQRQAATMIKDEELKRWFDAHREHYRIKEAVDISDIYVPFQSERDSSGAEVITENEKARCQNVALELFKSIRTQKLTFAQVFGYFGRNADPDADSHGHIGWVDRTGDRGKRGSRQIPERVMNAAFATQPPFPSLLEPVLHDSGVDIIMVHGRRAAEEPVLALMRAKVLNDLIDEQIEPRTKTLLDSLRRAATIEYTSLPPLIAERARMAHVPEEVTASTSSASAAPAPVAVP